MISVFLHNVQTPIMKIMIYLVLKKLTFSKISFELYSFMGVYIILNNIRFDV